MKVIKLMKKMICKPWSMLLLCALLVIPCTSQAQTNTPFIWGMNGHPLSQDPYNAMPIANQIAALKDLGMNYYRCDFYSDVYHPGLNNWITELTKNGIKILPVLFPPLDIEKETDTNRIYTVSRDYVKGFVSRYKGRVEVWDLHNELDNYCLIKYGEKDANGKTWTWGDPNGNVVTEYEPVRTKKVAAMLKGMYDGMKLGDPAAKGMINSGGWLHYAWFQALMNQGVQFDIIGYHWYSEMGPLVKANGTTINVLEELVKYGKDIWLAENNRRNGDQGGKEIDQSDYMFRALTGFYSLRPKIKAYFIYQLLDQPHLGTSNGESYYGLIRIKKDPTGKWWLLGDKKPAYTRVKDTIKAVTVTK